MEKNELLDITYKKVTSNELRVIKKSAYCLSLVTCCLLFLTSCSLPRLIVLDDPLTPEEHINLGVAYEKKGLYGSAVEEYKKASKKLPIAYLYLGNAYMQSGSFDEAEKHYKKAIKKQPDFADAYNNLAWLYYTKARGMEINAEDITDNLKEAEELTIKALELNPSNENYKSTLNKIRELKSKNRL